MGPPLARRCLRCLAAREGDDGSSLRPATATGSPRSALRPRSSTPQAMILPDVRGLHPFYEELALRFGDAGVHALALDYYGRTAGPGAAATSTISRTSNRRPMPTSVSTWRRPWPTCARPRGRGPHRCSRWSSAPGGRLSFNQAAAEPWPASSASTAGWRKPSLRTPPPRGPGTEVPVPGVGPVRRRRPRDHGRARCGLSGGA